MTVSFRAMRPGDRRFVVDSWRSSFKTSYAAGLIAMPDYARVMDDQIGKILDRPTVDTIVCYETDAPADVELNGFITFDKSGFKMAGEDGRLRDCDDPYVYYVLVKKDYRRQGLARALFKRADIDPTKPFYFACKVTLLQRLTRQIPLAKWNPLVARHPKEPA